MQAVLSFARFPLQGQTFQCLLAATKLAKEREIKMTVALTQRTVGDRMLCAENVRAILQWSRRTARRATRRRAPGSEQEILHCKKQGLDKLTEVPQREAVKILFKMVIDKARNENPNTSFSVFTNGGTE
jgi:hypothetical protein